MEYYLEDGYSNETMELDGSEYSECEIEEMKRELYEVEQQYDNWNLLSREIVEIETAYEYDNMQRLEAIDRMCEMCSADSYMKNLWEAKAAILNSLRQSAIDFHDNFEEEDRSIRSDYEERITKLHNDLYM